MIVDELIAILGYDVKGEDDLRRFNQGMDRAADKAKAFAATLVKIGAVAGAAFGAAMAGLAKSVISTSAQFEGFETSLVTLEGSSDKARQSMDWIGDFARKTPFDVAGITEAFIKLKTYGLDPLAGDALQTLGDTASAMNKPLNQAVEALADATTFQFERLREFGLVASQAGDQVTFRWQQNGKEMTRVVKKNGEDIRRFILDNLGSRFNGAMLRQSKTWDGMMSNLGDSWDDFKLRIGRGGFFDAVKAKLAGILDYIGQLDADGTLDKWASNLSATFTAVANAVGVVAERLATNGRFIANWFASLDPARVQDLKLAIMALGVWVFPTIAAIVALAFVIDEFLTSLRGGKTVFGDFQQAWSNALLNMDAQWQMFATRVRGAFKDFARNLATDLQLPDWLRKTMGIADGEAIDRQAMFNNRGEDLVGGGVAGLKDSFSAYTDNIETPGSRARDNNMMSQSEGSGFDNFLRNMSKLDGSNAAAATINDNKQDNRDQSVTSTVTVHQTVQQAVQAPGALAQAVGKAGQAASRQASRFEMEPAF